MLFTVFQPKEEHSFSQKSWQSSSLRKRPASENDFSNIYGSFTGRKENSDNTSLTLNKQPFGFMVTDEKQTDKQCDQQVPFNPACTSSNEGKGNQLTTIPASPKDSYNSIRHKTLNTRDSTESKRSSSQILALFSSSKNTGQRFRIAKNGGDSDLFHAAEYENSNLGHPNSEEVFDENQLTKHEHDFRIYADSSLEQTRDCQPNLVEGESAAEADNAQRNEDLFESLNLSPDFEFNHSGDQQGSCGWNVGVDASQYVINRSPHVETLEASSGNPPIVVASTSFVATNFCPPQQYSQGLTLAYTDQGLVQQRISVLPSNLTDNRMLADSKYDTSTSTDVPTSSQNMSVDHTKPNFQSGFCTPPESISAFSITGSQEEGSKLVGSPDAKLHDGGFKSAGNFGPWSTSCFESKLGDEVNDSLQLDISLSPASQSFWINEAKQKNTSTGAVVATQVIPCDSRTVSAAKPAYGDCKSLTHYHSLHVALYMTVVLHWAVTSGFA